MENSALAVANYFISQSFDLKIPLSPVRLISLVYYSKAWSLALRDSELFEERAETWKYGPVIRVVYDEFKEFGRNAICRYGSEVVCHMTGMQTQKFPVSSEVKVFLDNVWRAYIHLTDAQIIKLEHLPNTPWSMSYKHGNIVLIPNCVIQEYYKKYYQQKTKKTYFE